MMTDVAIVGGGLAGLIAAHRLHQAGKRFVLLEARDRLGGRILSAGGPEASFDLGPSWFWPQGQGQLERLVQELGLDIFPQHIDGLMLVERHLQAPPQRYPGYGQYPPSMRIAGGTATISRALAAHIPAECIRLDTAVSGLRRIEDGIEVMLASAEPVPVRQAIIAAPPRLAGRSLTFDPAMDPGTSALWLGTATWMAPHAKFIATYDRPFWREAGLSGAVQSMVGPMGEIHDATSTSGRGALFGFVGIDAATRRRVGEERLLQACLQQLIRLFGPQAGEPREVLFKDWSTDPLTATEADMVGGEHLVPVRSAWVTGAWAECLSMAGSETSDSEPGYLAGAVQAAERAVAERLAALTPNEQSKAV